MGVANRSEDDFIDKVRREWKRAYPEFDTAPVEVMGRIARINAQEKQELEENDDALNYKGTSHIGKLGVEQSYEAQLHGTSGREQMEVTSTGQIVRQLASMPATICQNDKWS